MSCATSDPWDPHFQTNWVFFFWKTVFIYHWYWSFCDTPRVCLYQYQNANSFVILEYYSFQLVSYQYFSRSILISKSSTLLVIFFISCLNCNGEVTKHILNDHGNDANWLKIMNGSQLCICRKEQENSL